MTSPLTVLNRQAFEALLRQTFDVMQGRTFAKCPVCRHTVMIQSEFFEANEFGRCSWECPECMACIDVTDMDDNYRLLRQFYREEREDDEPAGGERR